MIRAVIDTNVLLQGLTLNGESGRIVDAWRDRVFLPCVSTALALEYEEVLLRRFPESRHDDFRAALQALLDRGEYVPIYFRLRPISPDPDDDFVLDGAFNAHASRVSHNARDLRVPSVDAGIDYLLPGEFLARLAPKE